MIYALGGMSLLSVILSAFLWFSHGKVDRLNQELGASQLATDTAVAANKTVRETLEVCKEINASNADQRDQAVERANDALRRAEVMRRLLEDSINEEITSDDTQCRLLTDPLPADLVSGLCIESAGNCD